MVMEEESFERRYNLLEELERGDCLVRYLARDSLSGVDVEIDVMKEIIEKKLPT
jgi:hypothetical protein